MSKEKFSVQLFDELQILLTARKKLTVKTEIDGVIADTAEKFISVLNAEIDDEVNQISTPSASTKKSEVPCNCVKEKNLQSIIENAAEHIKEISTLDKKFAAIVIAPLDELLAAGN